MSTKLLTAQEAIGILNPSERLAPSIHIVDNMALPSSSAAVREVKSGYFPYYFECPSRF